MFNNTTEESFLHPRNSSDDKSPQMEPHLHQIAFVVSIVLACLSPVTVVGNGLILVAIWKKTFERTPFHILLSILAFTDLCTGLVVQPFYAVATLLSLSNAKIARKREMTVIMFIFNGVFIYLLAISVLLLTLMAVERWLHMSRRSLVTSRRGYLTVIMLLLIPIPLVVLQVLNSIKPSYIREISIMFTFMILVCFLITTISHFNVFRIIRRHQRQVQTNEASRGSGQPAINLAKYKKSVITILYILLLFSFCFLPYIVSLWVYLSLGKNLETTIAYAVTLTLYFVSSFLNPCLYVWRMNDIRAGVKQIFCRQ